MVQQNSKGLRPIGNILPDVQKKIGQKRQEILNILKAGESPELSETVLTADSDMFAFAVHMSDQYRIVVQGDVGDSFAAKNLLPRFSETMAYFNKLEQKRIEGRVQTFGAHFNVYDVEADYKGKGGSLYKVDSDVADPLLETYADVAQHCFDQPKFKLCLLNHFQLAQLTETQPVLLTAADGMILEDEHGQSLDIGAGQWTYLDEGIKRTFNQKQNPIVPYFDYTQNSPKIKFTFHEVVAVAFIADESWQKMQNNMQHLKLS